MTSYIHSPAAPPQSGHTTGRPARCGKMLGKSHPFSNDPKKVTCSICLSRLLVDLNDNKKIEYDPMEEVRKYPSPTGKPATIPLRILPEYMKFHNLDPVRYRGGYNVLLVKKKESESESD